MGDISKTLARELKKLDAPLPLHTRVQVERILANISASQCARAMGWSHTLWQEMERGERLLSGRERQRVARILGVTVKRLQGEQAKATPGWVPMGRPWPKKVAA